MLLRFRDAVELKFGEIAKERWMDVEEKMDAAADAIPWKPIEPLVLVDL